MTYALQSQDSACARVIRCRTVADKVPVPARATLENDVRRLLDHAQRRIGAKVPEMVDALGGLQPRGAGTRRSWYDWHERPETVSALTAMAAIHLLGPEAAIDVLFGDQASSVGDQSSRFSAAEGDTQELRRQLTDVQSELARQRRLTAEVQGRLEELAATVEGRRSVARMSVSDLEKLIAEIESDMEHVGRRIGRQWDVSAETDDNVSQGERLHSRIGTLEARMALVAKMLGTPLGHYPGAPEPADIESGAFRDWLAEVTALLQQQMPAVLERADALVDTPDRADRTGEIG
jgi:hypothetical protein